MSQENVDIVQEEEVQRVLEPEYVYPDDHVEKVLEDSPLTHQYLKYYQGFGFDSNKRYNLHLIDNEHIIYISGASFYILNIETKEKRIFFTKDGAGIGSVAVHPSKQYFAVAEKGVSPNIYIYEYPSLRLKRILRKGTERSYSNICFSVSGDKLASVGSAPDYQICVWDWMGERILLKAKAFSQEVYRVSFSNYDDDILTTSGTGHIKFWKIAETFTGLKLKGEIAKFGQIELSDVTSFFTFPDEKVLSSTEYGKLLLWEGNMIKAVVTIDKETPCHNGAIEAIFLETIPGEDKQYIVTAGSDGFIKFWDFDELDQAEGDDHSNFFIHPAKVIEIKNSSNQRSASILTIERSPNFWLIYDTNGIVWKLRLPNFDQEIVLETNAGKMMDLCLSNSVNAGVSIGEDGAVRLWDYVSRRETYSREFKGKGTCLEWAPKNNSNRGRVLYAGYSNGIMRVVCLNQTGFTLLRAIKVHSESLFKIKASPSGQILVIATRTGALFFLEIDPQKPQNLQPYCLLEMGIQINDFCWHENSRKLLFACEDGRVVEMTIPTQDQCDTTETYLRDLSDVRMRSYRIKMMESQKPKHDEMEDLLLGWKDHKALKEKQDEEWEPAPIFSCSYVDAEGSQFICSVDGKFQGFYYICSFEEERPIMGITSPKIPARSLRFFDGYTLLVAGLDDGTFLLKRKENFEPHLIKLAHDRDNGNVRKVEFSHDNLMCLTCSEDGTINSYLMDLPGLKAGVNEQEHEIHYPEPSESIPEYFYDGEIDLNMNVEEDIEDENIYSLQEDKLHTEEDNKKNLAEKKKQKVLQQVKSLQEKFLELLKKNNTNEPSFRLNEEELVVDPQYQEILENEISDILEETRKELSWDLAYNELRANKLKQYFLDELHTERICLKSFDQKHRVNAFKVKNLSPYIEAKLDEINREIEEENRIQAEESSPNANRDGTINFDESRSGDERSRRLASQASRSIMKMQTEKLDQTEGDIKSKFGKQKTVAADQTANKMGTTFGTVGPNATQGNVNPNATIAQAAQTTTHQKYDRERAKKEEAERLAVKEELEKSMPTYEAFQPDHIKAINLEMERLGDYKLKSSKDYIVPEDQRMNVEKKRKHIFLLYEVLFRSKKDFNEKIIDLRKRKFDIINKITKSNERLKEIDKELGVEEEYFTASIDPVLETPEKYYDVTEDIVDEYSKKKDQEKLAAANKNTSFFGGAAGPNATATSSNSGTNQPAAQDAKKDEKAAAQPKGNLIPIQTRDRKTKKVEESALEREIKLANELRLTSEKESLKSELENDIKSFDKQITKLQEEKAVLEWNMKVVEMKLITFSQELIILEDMQEHDDQLISKLLNARKDKANFESQNADYAAQILEKKQNHFNVDKKLNETINEYNKYFLDDINRANKIFAYFQRMHKKRKNKEMNKKKDDEEGDDDGESDEDDESFDEEEDEEEKVDVSPVMNDPNLRKLVDTRNELLDEKSQLEEDMNKLQNERRIIDNRLGQIDELIKNTESDLRDYQRQKLQRVNKLIVSHFLKLSQIQNLVKHADANGNELYQMPQDLLHTILFTENELNRLHSRISELDAEKQEVLRQHEKLTKEKRKLTRGINEKNKECDEARKRYQEEHMLKFGDVIDFSVLDSLVPTKEVLGKREDFKKEEREAEKRVEEAKNKYLLTKKRLFEEKKENTRILNKITALGDRQMKLNKNLDSTNKQIFKEDNEDRKTNLSKEKSHLVELVRFLAKEIEDLKTEIALFKKKGGHIYTMVTSNKKTLEDII